MGKQLFLFSPNTTNFDTSFRIGERLCYTRRTDGYTFLCVGGLNLLLKPSGILFRAHSTPDLENGHYVPNLDELSLDEIMGFARHIVYLQETHQLEWDTEVRRYKFNYQYVA